MVRMSEHTGLISPYQLLIIAASILSYLILDQLTGAHLYLDIA